MLLFRLAIELVLRNIHIVYGNKSLEFLLLCCSSSWVFYSLARAAGLTVSGDEVVFRFSRMDAFGEDVFSTVERFEHSDGSSVNLIVTPPRGVV